SPGGAPSLAEEKNCCTDSIGNQSHGDDFGGKNQWTRDVDDRVDGEEDGQQRDDEAANGRESQPQARSGEYRGCAHDRDSKHYGVDDSIKNVGGIIYELESFLHSRTDLTGYSNYQC